MIPVLGLSDSGTTIFIGLLLSGTLRDQQTTGQPLSLQFGAWP